MAVSTAIHQEPITTRLLFSDFSNVCYNMSFARFDCICCCRTKKGNFDQHKYVIVIFSYSYCNIIVYPLAKG